MKVPFIMDLMTDEDAKSVLRVILATQVYNRPFAAPPGVPAERLAILQKAFKDTLADPEVKAEAERTGVSLRYLAPQDFPKLLDMTLGVSPQMQQRAIAELKKAGWSGF
jgi:tripartite-type tricarboxylate transporter receptor subunit TctC